MKSIEIQNATKTYPNGVTALKDVSCTIRQGEFVVVMGQSGSRYAIFRPCGNQRKGYGKPQKK